MTRNRKLTGGAAAALLLALGDDRVHLSAPVPLVIRD
jgi:hypothetical protein